MSIPEFNVAMEVSKLKSDPAKVANPAKVEGRLATLATLAGVPPRFEAVSALPNFSNFSRPPLPDGQGQAIPPPTGPAPEGTGLEWVICPPEYDAEKYGSQWAAFDLADMCKLYSIRVVRAGGRVLAVYPPELPAELVAYASELLAEARDFLRQHLDRLPVLEPAAAVEHIMEIMRQHDGLRFTRGEDGSRWPMYPSTWTAGQRVTLQSLWLTAGDSLDLDEFMEVDA